MDAVNEAIGSAEFLSGLRWGAIAAAGALIVGIAWRRWRGEPAPVAALAAVVAGALAMPTVRAIDANLLVGLGLLALAGVVFPWTRRVPLLSVLMALPGAWLITQSDLPESGWVLWLVIGAIPIAGPVISWFDESGEGSAFPAVLFAISAAGVWVTVPDTEEALVLLGAMAAPTLLAWPLRVARLGAIGAHSLVGLFIWVIAWGGRGRPGSVVGAVAALGMLVAAPIAARLAEKRAVTSSGWTGLSLVVLHAVAVAVVTRIAGLEFGARDAAMIAGPTVLVALMIWSLIEVRTTPKSTRAD